MKYEFRVINRPMSVAVAAAAASINDDQLVKSDDWPFVNLVKRVTCAV